MTDLKAKIRTSCQVLILPTLVVALAAASGRGVSDRVAKVAAGKPTVEQVQDGPAQLSETLRSHWVRLDDRGDIHGRISTLIATGGRTRGTAGLQIFFVQNERVVATTTTDANGRFTVSGLRAGTYTLAASGRDGFMAYGVEVVDAKEIEMARAAGAIPINFQPVLSELQINAAAVPPTYRTLKNIASRYLADPVTQSIARSNDKPEGELQVKPETGSGGFQVLTQSGVLSGRISTVRRDSRSSKLRQMNVFLLQDDWVVKQAEVKPDGSFEFNGVQDGLYSFVAAGQGGFAAIGFEAVSERTASQRDPASFDDTNFAFAAAGRAPKASPLQVVLTQEDYAFLQAQIDRVNRLNGAGPVAQGGPGGAAPTPFAPGGGFGGGGGTPLLNDLTIPLLAGLGAAGFAIAADDDDPAPFIQQASPAFPIIVVP